MNRTLIFILKHRAALALCAFFLIAFPALAETIPLQRSSLSIVDGMAVLDAQYEVSISEPLKNALERGAPLYFTLEWRVTQPRWYWFDAVLHEKEELLDLRFSPLTLQYRFSSGWLMENVSALSVAEQLIGNISARPLFSVTELNPKKRYQFSFRLTLAKNRMPKSLQFSAGDLDLSSHWTTLDFYP